MKKHLFLVLLGLAFLLPACDLIPGTTLRIGLSPYWYDMDLFHAYRAYQQTLARKSGFMVRVLTYPDVESVERALARGEIDLSILDPAGRCRLEAAQKGTPVVDLIPWGLDTTGTWYTLSWKDLPAGDSVLTPRQPDTTQLLLLRGEGFEGCAESAPILPEGLTVISSEDVRELFRRWLKGEAKTLIAPDLIARQMDFAFGIADSAYDMRPLNPIGSYAWVARADLPEDILNQVRKDLKRERGVHILDRMGIAGFVPPGETLILPPE